MESETKERVLTLFTIPMDDTEFESFISAIVNSQKPLIEDWEEGELAK